MFEELKRLVEHESPSHNKTSLDGLAQILAERLAALGGKTDVVENNAGGNHVLARFTGSDQKPPALVLGHFDTVWPIGTLARMPVREEKGRLFGPGVFDMKASLVMMNQALEALQALGLKMPRPLIVLYTSDEERINACALRRATSKV